MVYVDVRWCMVVYGSVLKISCCAVVYGSVWWCGGVRWCMVVYGGVWWCAVVYADVNPTDAISLHAPSLARRPRTRLVCTRGRASVDTFYAPAALYDNHIFGTGNVGQCQRKLNDTTVMDSVMT